MASLILSSGPLAYYRLDESSAASPAVDTAGGFDGAYGGDLGLGVASLRPPTFPGFYSGNTALNTLAYTPEFNGDRARLELEYEHREPAGLDPS